MSDSVKVVDSRTLQKYHTRAQSGHIHKGHSIVAANASIPTKFQTIVTDNSDRNGFLAKSKRFHADAYMTEAPPPGSYGEVGQFDKVSPSYSKKGTGSFASKSRRQLKYLGSGGPGPGLYALPSLLNTRKDFNKSHVERLFQLPIAEQREKDNNNPAPNSYEVLKYKHGKANNVTAHAAFNSKSKRELMDLSEQKRNPAPGQYEVTDSVMHDSVKIPMSSFNSTTKRQMQRDAEPFPGPGTYDPNAPVDHPAKLIFPRKHYLCISAPAMPLPSTPPAPGPGAYELRNFEDPQKHYMSSSAFVSTTGRWAIQPANTEFPGPSHYRPVHIGKQSFIFNSNKKWL